jgi:hypothetical protein
MIEQIFEYLNGKIGTVKSGNVNVEGSIEGSVLFSYQQYYGLKLLAKLKWNSHYKQIVNNIDSNIDLEVLKEQLVQVGKINYYNTKSCQLFYDKDKNLIIRLKSENYNENQNKNLLDYI